MKHNRVHGSRIRGGTRDSAQRFDAKKNGSPRAEKGSDQAEAKRSPSIAEAVPARQKARKIVGTAVNVLLWAVLAVSLVLMLLSVLSRSNGKSTGVLGIGLYQIVSGSMTPEINVGDVIVGKKTDFDDLKKGQNVVFYDAARDILIAHKIVGLGDGYVITHGIANPDGANETVAEADIIARQVLRLPGLGYALNFMRSGAGFFLIVLLPLSGLIVWQTVSLGRRVKDYRQDGADPSAETEAMKTEIALLKEKLDAGCGRAEENGPDGAENADPGPEAEKTLPPSPPDKADARDSAKTKDGN